MKSMSPVPSRREMHAVIRHAEAFERVRGVTAQVSSNRALDDELYREFRSRFPSVNVHNLRGAEPALRNVEKWKSFHAHFEERIAGPNQATMSTLDASRGLRDLDNVVFVGRLVWLAIEVCRLRESGTVAAGA